MAKNNHSIGNAGEFYVPSSACPARLHRRQDDDGQTLIDVVATDPETLKTVNIQVKSTAEFSGYWMTGTKPANPLKPLVRIRFIEGAH